MVAAADKLRNIPEEKTILAQRYQSLNGRRLN
jgi:hypothetical protein